MGLKLNKTQLPGFQNEPWFEVSAGPTRFLAHKSQFSALTDKSEILALAKQCLTQVVIETSSYCNRTCVFCPNKDGIRLHKQFLDFNVYRRIVSDLQLIEFSGSILFHLYNEPLVDDHIYQYIVHAHKLIPFARIGLNTNGDYLTLDILEKLAISGLSQLNVSIYGRNPGQFNLVHIEERISTLLEKLELVPINNSNPLEIRTHKNGVGIRIFAQDYSKTGYDRGGLVDAGLQNLRKSPCSSPFKEILVGYNGSVVPCCNIHPGAQEHAEFVIDTVSVKKGILEIFASQNQAEWRKRLLRYQQHSGPCAKCTRQDCGDVSTEDAQAFNNVCRQLLD